MTTFSYFEEIESELAIEAPPVVYKYRTWKDKNHQSLLINQQLYFSHPFDLNDPLDVRPETVFNTEEFFDEQYYNKLLASAKEMNPNLYSEEEYKQAAMAQWELTKAEPNIVVQNLENYNSERGNFNLYGVFSTGTNELSEKTWDEYGDHHAGYCIGFHTLELCRNIKSGYGFVKYSDAPINYSFLRQSDESELEALYYKKEIWKEENEFRFITASIGFFSERLQAFSVDVVAQLVLGYNISEADERAIIEIVETKYPKGLPVYKTARLPDQSLTKSRIR